MKEILEVCKFFKSMDVDKITGELASSGKDKGRNRVYTKSITKSGDEVYFLTCFGDDRSLVIVSNKNLSGGSVVFDSIQFNEQNTYAIRVYGTGLEDGEAEVSVFTSMAEGTVVTYPAVTGGTVEVMVPANVMDRNAVIDIMPASNVEKGYVVAAGDSNFTGEILTNTAYKFAARKESEVPLDMNFSGQVTISIPYKDDNDNGIVDGTTVRARDLRMFWYYSTFWGNDWHLQDGSYVDTESKTVKLEVDHFSIYCLGGFFYEDEDNSIDEAACYPNPFSEVTKIFYTLSRSGNVTVGIYTTSGRLIKNVINAEWQEFGYADAVWYGKDEAGNEVSNGVYFFQIKLDRDNKEAFKTGKIVKMK